MYAFVVLFVLSLGCSGVRLSVRGQGLVVAGCWCCGIESAVVSDLAALLLVGVGGVVVFGE